MGLRGPAAEIGQGRGSQGTETAIRRVRSAVRGQYTLRLDLHFTHKYHSIIIIVFTAVLAMSFFSLFSPVVYYRNI